MRIKTLLHEMLCILVGIGLVLLVFIAGFKAGHDAALTPPRLQSSPSLPAPDARASEDYRNRCVCGSTQTCAFGPGVVGEQRCVTDAVMTNRWSRCEPVPDPRTVRQ